MRMVLAELLTIDAYKTADGWKWSTVGDYSPPPLFDNEVQELIALGLVAHHDGVLTLTPERQAHRDSGSMTRVRIRTKALAAVSMFAADKGDTH